MSSSFLLAWFQLCLIVGSKTTALSHARLFVEQWSS